MVSTPCSESIPYSGNDVDAIEEEVLHYIFFALLFKDQKKNMSLECGKSRKPELTTGRKQHVLY